MPHDVDEHVGKRARVEHRCHREAQRVEHIAGRLVLEEGLRRCAPAWRAADAGHSRSHRRPPCCPAHARLSVRSATASSADPPESRANTISLYAAHATVHRGSAWVIAEMRIESWIRRCRPVPPEQLADNASATRCRPAPDRTRWSPGPGLAKLVQAGQRRPAHVARPLALEPAGPAPLQPVEHVPGRRQHDVVSRGRGRPAAPHGSGRCRRWRGPAGQWNGPPPTISRTPSGYRDLNVGPGRELHRRPERVPGMHAEQRARVAIAHEY